MPARLGTNIIAVGQRGANSWASCPAPLTIMRYVFTCWRQIFSSIADSFVSIGAGTVWSTDVTSRVTPRLTAISLHSARSFSQKRSSSSSSLWRISNVKRTSPGITFGVFGYTSSLPEVATRGSPAVLAALLPHTAFQPH